MVGVLGRYAPVWLAQFAGLVPAGEQAVLQQQVQGSGRERMLRELAGVLEIISAERVLVLVLEDLQWSDTATLDALTYLAQRRRPIQLYILCTYRPAEVVVSRHPLRQVVQELAGR